MKKNTAKLLTGFHRLLDAQEFKSKEDLEAFMNNLIGQPIPSFPEEALSLKERAQDLVMEAYNLKPARAKRKIEAALKLDPDCIEAYEYLGDLGHSIQISIPFYEKGIEIGRRLFGGNYLKKNKGFFWSLHETRTFMRCLEQYSMNLYSLGKTKETVAVLEEMIELNPNDNQGVRDHLLLYLIELDENEKFRKYAKKYKDDSMAFPLFTRALFAFKTEGDSANAYKLLKRAVQHNMFVPARILSANPPTEYPGHYGIGDENEALYFANFAHAAWRKVEGAVEWLRKHTSM